MSEGAHIVATVDATFQNTEELDATVSQKSDLSVSVSQDTPINASLSSDINELAMELSSDQEIDVDLGQVYSSGDCKVLYNTSQFWNSHPKTLSKKGYLYIYSDYKKDEQGRDLAGVKVGDGLAYLIDLPFMDKLYSQHIEDDTIHITAQERNFWNNKVRCYIDPVNDKRLIFTTK